MAVKIHAKHFVRDFIAAWTKVMELDRFDLNAKANNTRQAMAAE